MRRVGQLITSKPVIFALRLILGMLFAYSGIAKIAVPAGFASDVANYRILPLAAVNVFALVLPWLELLCGLSLLSRIGHRSGALLACMLNVMFIFAAASAMARGLDIECGCATLASSGKVGWELICRDSILLIMSLLILKACSADSGAELTTQTDPAQLQH